MKINVDRMALLAGLPAGSRSTQTLSEQVLPADEAKHGHGHDKHGKEKHGHGHGHGHHGKHKHNHDAAVFSVGVFAHCAE